MSELYDEEYDVPDDRDTEEFDVAGRLIHETDKAMLVSVRGRQVWVPHSIGRFSLGILVVPVWFAEEHGLDKPLRLPTVV